MPNGPSAVLVRSGWIVGICALVFAAATLVASLLHTDEYAASTALLLRERTFGEALLGGTGPGATEQSSTVSNAGALVSLPVIAARTAADLGGDRTAAEIADRVEVRPDVGTGVVTLTATDSDPTEAAAIANTYAEQYVAFSRRVQHRLLRRVIQHGERAPPAPLGISPEPGRSRGALVYSLARMRLLDVLRGGDVEQVGRAVAPRQPSSPRIPRDVLLGALVGSLIGAALALLSRTIAPPAAGSPRRS